MSTTIGPNGVDKVQDGVLTAADVAAAAVGAAGIQRMQLFAARTASGTYVDFSPADGTGIPSWAKKVSILLDSVSTSGSSVPLVQVGAGSVDTTGYLGSTTILTSGQATLQITTGLPLIQSIAAAWVFSTAMELLQLSSGLWIVRGGGCVTSGSTASIVYGGRKPVSGALDRIRITTVNGT